MLQMKNNKLWKGAKEDVLDLWHKTQSLINNIWSLNSKRFSQFYDNLKVYCLIKIQDNLITESGFISIWTQGQTYRKFLKLRFRRNRQRIKSPEQWKLRSSIRKASGNCLAIPRIVMSVPIFLGELRQRKHFKKVTKLKKTQFKP